MIRSEIQALMDAGQDCEASERSQEYAHGGAISHTRVSPDLVRVTLSPGTVYAQTGGQWVHIGTTDRIEYRADDAEWNAAVPTLRQYQGVLRMEMTADERTGLRRYLDALTGGTERRSAMRTAYRAKTRRRNRRRK